MRRGFLGLVFWLAACLAAAAQERVWIQVEAQPSLRQAEDRVRVYAAQLPDVAGFQLSGRWYGIALGPYSRADAQQRLAALRAQRLVPSDAYLVEAGRFQRQFWPIGAADLTRPGIVAPALPTAAPSVRAPAPVPADETPREARAAEALLTRDEKRLIQTALAAEGFYNSTVDGLFGRGTRASMGDWQIANGFEPTGVLTTAQRAALIESYNSILDGLGLARVVEAEAGIAMLMPMDQIAFAEYEAPFVHYEATGTEGIALSLISQDGPRARFQGLYNVLQTLDIVPPQGPRELGRDRFTITGIDATRHTTVDVRYADGAMKGFILVWPAGDDRRLTRVLSEVRASFTVLPGTLDPALSPPNEAQSLDLLSGLDIRQPQRAATGFFVDDRGTVLTAAETLGTCERVSIGAGVDAEVVFTDVDLGLALLKPKRAITPLAYATFQPSVPRLRDEVAVAGFSYGGDLGAPTLTLGQLADLKGLDGEESVKRLELRAEPGDSGGPVFDRGGAVLGLLRPAPVREGQVLPATVRLAVDAETIRARLALEGVAIEEAAAPAVLDPVELSALAADIAVLVECW
ncbi:MAG: trypsin-like peptidase domain-containing protein [Pseudomonadota bacterium]